MKSLNELNEGIQPFTKEDVDKAWKNGYAQGLNDGRRQGVAETQEKANKWTDHNDEYQQIIEGYQYF